MKIHVHIDEAEPFDIEVRGGDVTSPAYHVNIQTKALDHLTVIEAMGDRHAHHATLNPLTLSRMSLVITTKEFAKPSPH